MMERVKLKCDYCKSVYFINIDTNIIENIKKLKLLACVRCPLNIRKNRFKKEDERHMEKKDIFVDGEWISVEIKSPKLHKFKEKVIEHIPIG